MARNMTNPRHGSRDPSRAAEGPEAEKSESVPPTSSSRRARYRERSATNRIRPWSQLPGVTAYMVFDPAGQLTDKWGDPGPIAVEKAASFRERALAGSLTGSFSLEAAGDDQRLLSVARADKWFVHVWILADADVTGILTVTGG